MRSANEPRPEGEPPEGLTSTSARGLARGLTALGVGWAVAVVACFAARGIEPWVPEGVPRALPLDFADRSCTWTSIESGRGSPADPWTYHGSDGGRRARCVSAPLALGVEQTLAIRYGGDPTDPDVTVALEAADGLDRWPLALPGRALHVWTTAFVPVPERARGRAVRLVVDDRSDRRFGFVAVRALAAVNGAVHSHGGLLLPRSLAVAAATLLLLLAWLTARVSARAAAVLTLAGLLTVFLQSRTFYLVDDWDLLRQLAEGPAPSFLLGYNQQFEPVVMAVYASVVWLFRSAYGPQQVIGITAHAAVVWLLVRLLRRHGISATVALGSALLYAVVWTHADVVPWFLELFYVSSSACVLIALDAAVGYVAGERGRLGTMVAASVIGTFSFIGGIVSFPLAAAYVGLMGKAGRLRAAAVLGVFAALTTTVAAFAVPLAGVAGEARPGQLGLMVRYLLAGVINGSLAPFLGAGRVGAGQVGVALVAVACIVVLAVPRVDGRLRRSVAFGLLWTVATYALQAVARWNLGPSQATSMRYSYFGMLAVAFVVACLVDGLVCTLRSSPLLLAHAREIRLLGALLLALLVAGQVDAYLRRIDAHEREYYAASRMHYELTSAQLRLAGQGLTAAPAGRVPPSFDTTVDWAAYVRVVRWLGRQPAGGGLPGAADGWTPFLD